ncbi:MAG: GEVED domain-containing protein [Hyphomonadaceae bacterium]
MRPVMTRFFLALTAALSLSAPNLTHAQTSIPADTISESTPLTSAQIFTNPAVTSCSANVSVLSDGNTDNPGFCPRSPLPVGYELELGFVPSSTDGMVGIRVWSNAGGSHTDDEIRQFGLEIDHIDRVSGAAQTLVIPVVDYGNLTFTPVTVEFEQADVPITLFDVSEVRVTNISNVTGGGTAPAREFQGLFGTADPVTVKSLTSANPTPDIGDIVTFEIEVTNTGTAIAYDVSLNDVLPSGLTATGNNGTVTAGTYNSSSGLWEIGELPAGASATLTLEGSVALGQSGLTIENTTTTATAFRASPNTAGDILSASVTIAAGAPPVCTVGNIVFDNVTSTSPISGINSLIDGNLGGNPRATFSSAATFTADITLELATAQTGPLALRLFNDGGTQNNGLNGSRGAGIAEFDNIQVFDSSGALIHTQPGRLVPGEALGDSGSISPSQDIHLLFQQDLVDAERIVVNGIRSYNGDSDPSTTSQFGVEEVREFQLNCTDGTPLTADLVTEKSVTSAVEPNEGDTVSFEITVTNNGPVNATGVTLTDLLPNGLTATSNNGSVSGTGGSTGGAYTDTSGLWEIGALAVGETATLALEGEVDSGQNGNTIENTTTAGLGEQPDLIMAGDVLSASVTISAPPFAPAIPTDTCRANWYYWNLPISNSDFVFWGNPRNSGFTPIDTNLGANGWYETTRAPNQTFLDQSVDFRPPESGSAGLTETFLGITRYEDVPNSTVQLDFDDPDRFEAHAFAVFDSSGNQIGRFPNITRVQNDQLYIHSSTATSGGEAVHLGVAWSTATNFTNERFTFTVPSDGVYFLHYIMQDDFNASRFLQDTFCGIDFSDAADVYPEASHVVTATTRLGASSTADTGATLDADNASDDGVPLPVLTQGAPATITADVTGAGGFLQGWVDFNGDGDFDDAGEQIATDLQDDGTGDDGTANDGTITFDAAVPLSAVTTQTFARFRWSTTSGLDATASASDGEVEDYAVTINQQALSSIPPSCAVPVPFNLSGITNASAQTNVSLGRILGDTTLTSNSGNASLRSGNANGDLELSFQNSGANFDAYRLNFSQPVQIVFSQAGPVGTNFNFAETWTIAATGGTLSVTDPGSEHTNIPGASAGNPLPELTNVIGDGTSTVSMTPTNLGTQTPLALSNWQVVSTPVTEIEVSVGFSGPFAGNASPIRISFCGTDHGDAPGFPDASHFVQDGISLGAATDVEGAGQSSPNADGDDSLGPENDDEDGVTIPTLTQSQSATISVDATGAGGFLQGWIDFNGDGDFDETGEQIASDLQLTSGTSGTISVPVTVPSDAVLTQTFARFRWSTTGGLDSTASASDGEVEDYAVTIEPGSIPVSGTVFFDNGTGTGATAHDGLIQGTEPRAGDVTVEAIDALTGDLVVTTQTNADGTYTLLLPDTQGGRETIVRIAPPADAFLISNLSALPIAEVDPANGMFTFTPTLGTDRAGLNFGLATEPRLTEDQSQSINSGGTALFAHRFSAGAPVEVSFGVENIVSGTETNFTNALFLDADCSGTIDAGEILLTGSRTLTADETICLLVRVASASGSAQGESLQFELVASGLYANTSETFRLVNHDTVTITDAAALRLTKTVCNPQTGLCDAVTGAGFDVANTGAPGDVLIYRIAFDNLGSEPLEDVVVNDDTPAFSSLGATLPSVVSNPIGLTCALSVPATPVTAYQGPLEWACPGQMLAGAQGIVSFEVQIAN